MFTLSLLFLRDVKWCLIVAHNAHITYLPNDKSIWLTDPLIIFSNVLATLGKARYRQPDGNEKRNSDKVTHVSPMSRRNVRSTRNPRDKYVDGKPAQHNRSTDRRAHQKTSSLQSNNRTIHLETTPYDPVREIETMLQSLGLHRVVSFPFSRQPRDKFILSFLSLHHSHRRCLYLSLPKQRKHASQSRIWKARVNTSVNRRRKEYDARVPSAERLRESHAGNLNHQRPSRFPRSHHAL